MYIAKDKIQMGIVAVTNGYNINAVTAKDAGDDWTEIPLLITIKPEDVIAIKQLYSIAPETVIVRDTLGNPVHTASSLLNLQELPDGSLKYPMVIQRSHPVGRLTFVLDWDGYLNDGYTTNNWNLNWNVTILEPDPLPSPMYYNSFWEGESETNYLTRPNFIETITTVNDNEINLAITNNIAAGWYWKYIPISVAIDANYVQQIARQAELGLIDPIVILEHNGVKTNYLAGELLTRRDQNDNIVIPIILDRDKRSGIIQILSDFDGLNKSRYYVSPLRINYIINPVNPPQEVSTIAYSGFDYGNKDKWYIEPEYITSSELEPPVGVDRSISISNNVAAGWYWTALGLVFNISARDITRMNAAYNNGFNNVSLVVKQNNNTIYSLKPSQILLLPNDGIGGRNLVIDVDRLAPNGQLVFDMDWDNTDLNYLPGKYVFNYTLVAKDPTPLTSRINYFGLSKNGLGQLVDLQSPDESYEYYKKLVIDKLDSLTATETITNNGDNRTVNITNKVNAGWYWTSVPVHFTIPQAAIELLDQVQQYNITQPVLTITAPWRVYTYTLAQVLALGNYGQDKYLTIEIPKTYATGRLTVVVDWDTPNRPEAIGTTSYIDYTLTVVDPPVKPSTVKWGGIDTGFENVIDANYLIPNAYRETVTTPNNNINVEITNTVNAGWYWNKIHTQLVINRLDVLALENAIRQGFTFTNITISLNGVITRLTYEEIINLDTKPNGDYLIPITLLRNAPSGVIRVTVDWDGNHEDYSNTITVINYNITAIDPSPLVSTLGYRGVLSLKETGQTISTSGGIINPGYLVETIGTNTDGYETEIVTNPDAGWYWNKVKTYLTINSPVIDFLQSSKERGHTGTVLTIINGEISNQYTTDDILDLNQDTDNKYLLPYFIPKSQPNGTLLLSVDWDTNEYPEATPSTLEIKYNIVINNPVQTPSQMMYHGVINDPEYVSTGEFALPRFINESIVSNVNNYRTVINVSSDAGWYWNKVRIAARISAQDLLVVQNAKDTGFIGTVLSMYHNGTLIHSLNNDDILDLLKDEDGNGLVEINLSNTVLTGTVTAVIDWDVNDLNYTQSNWKLDYTLNFTRPPIITPVFSIVNGNSTVANRFNASTYTVNTSGPNVTINTNFVFSETSENIPFDIVLDNATLDYIVQLEGYDPSLEILTLPNGTKLSSNYITNAIRGTGFRLSFVANKTANTGIYPVSLDLDGQHTVFGIVNFDARYQFVHKPRLPSELTVTYLDTISNKFINGWGSDKEINVILSSAPTSSDTIEYEFFIPSSNYLAFKEARRLGLANNVVVMTITMHDTNQVTAINASQLESMISLTDDSDASLIVNLPIMGGNFTIDYHWTKGYNGYTLTSDEYVVNRTVLVDPELVVIPNTWTTSYASTIIHPDEYSMNIGINSKSRNTVTVNLDENNPINKNKVLATIQFPEVISNRLREILAIDPNKAVLQDQQTGFWITVGDLNANHKVDDTFTYDITLTRGVSGTNRYNLNLNSPGENYYDLFIFEVDYQVIEGIGINPNLLVTTNNLGGDYTLVSNNSSVANRNTITLETVDSAVSTFNVELVIPRMYDLLIKESINNNGAAIVLSSGLFKVTGTQYLTLGTDSDGNKVIPNFPITVDPDNYGEDGMVHHELDVLLTYTPGYTGIKSGIHKLIFKVDVLALEIDCTGSTSSTFVDTTANVTELLYDVQLDGVTHRGINYSRLVDLCKGSGIEIIPMGAKPTYPVIPSTEDVTVEFDIDGFWIPEVNGVALTDEPVSAEQAMELLALQGITFVSTNADTDGASE